MIEYTWFQRVNEKPFELSYDQTIELEGFFISQISLRSDSERPRKLNQILQNLQIEPLKEGEETSEKMRLFIDKLRNHPFSVTIEVTRVSESQVNQYPYRVTTILTHSYARA